MYKKEFQATLAWDSLLQGTMLDHFVFSSLSLHHAGKRYLNLKNGGGRSVGAAEDHMKSRKDC